jgi:hypothetical protein
MLFLRQYRVYLDSLEHTRIEVLVVLQQVLQVQHAFGHQNILDVLEFTVVQNKPIGVGEDLAKAITNSAATKIHKSAHHFKDLQ